MNRAQRRLFQARNRGVFQSELTQRANDQAFTELLRKQMQEEDNGAPVPGDVAEKMTKAKTHDILWQVMVTEKETGDLVPYGPMMNQEAIGMMAERVNTQIVKGLRRDWTKAEAYPMTRIAGAH